jgi:hypothetical protein
MNQVMTARAGTVHARFTTMTTKATKARRHPPRELLQTGGM